MGAGASASSAGSMAEEPDDDALLSFLGEDVDRAERLLSRAERLMLLGLKRKTFWDVVQHLEAKLAPKVGMREKKPYKKRPKKKAPHQGGNCIFDQLIGTLKSWDGKDGKPKDDEVKAFLKQLLREGPQETNVKALEIKLMALTPTLFASWA
ncbi:unnamed protein product [Durusdinium trenchii]|uniref:Uncharacterized protein n=1 Tax=Durusdinium trenchii TaxID=1381693 RepID=A0ABP0KRM4_9DINO